jgi:hypothetical protein
MGSSSKRQTTMAKLARERALQEKRERKREKKEARKQEAAAQKAAAEGGEPVPVEPADEPEDATL